MPDQIDFIHQANHNERCAKRLVADPQIYDWGIIAAFYSAVHLVEAGFIIKHAGSKPKHIEIHAWRQEKVRELFGYACYKHYCILRQASQNVRYLEEDIPFGNIPSHSYFTIGQAADLCKNELAQIKTIIQAATGINLS